ncbi:GRAS family protein [Arsenicibacter rosenii]|uniref:Uncharacterized protein n=1 Tax=Arsenicibacter rosenii TaxID=1750698 RepID=A0A1S2VHP0_9BACT|nr:GRAS family protein [Arsenicibacter rosenii]OIN58243.1 hypothetical protein BLX24_14640 [Arsenicibacter rosenii]
MEAIDTNALLQLRNLANRMPDALTETDQQVLEAIYYESVEDLDNPVSLFAYTLAKAMRKQVAGGQSQEHIYLQRFDIPQIRLFELLIQQFPLANLSQHCTNTLLIDALADCEYPVLMDIGIGTGFQVATIIGGLAAKTGSQVKQLHVAGIEPFADALVAAAQNIQQAATRAPFAVTLTTRTDFIENLSINDLRQMLPAEHDGIFANASFALHHIQGAAQRKVVFETLKALPVQALVLSEPNSNHYTADYAERFTNCVQHYGALFRIIDTLPITATEKTALKLFFSREIDDVLGNAETVRVEKHYATEQWVALFAETGFQLRKRDASFSYTTLNGTQLETYLPDRYATVFNGEEITSLFWAE